MNVVFVKFAMEYAQKHFSSEIYENYIKKMSDYSLTIAKFSNSNPIICMTASILHKLADGVTGDFRANSVNPVLREIGFSSSTIESINACINHLLPEHRLLQISNEEKVVGDAYLLTYWGEFQNNFTPQFQFDISTDLWSYTNKIGEEIELATSRLTKIYK